MLTKPFFDRADDAYDLLLTFHAIISGSCALRLLLPQSDIFWTPHDLDIYICEKEAQPLLLTLLAHGYTFTSPSFTANAPYSSSHVHSVYVLHRNSSKIDVIISNSISAVSPIFQFHSTILMNFVTAHSVYCAYPDLTLRQLSLVNPYVIYEQPLQRSTVHALLKYSERNIEYITCQQSHEERECWKDHTRCIDDEYGIWISCSPSVN
ncbi:hypothetical protein EDD15DRAFT_2163016 [Pisolithus albus]|nr:hypothetical protein EDD15DRAFT_2163016 [Pisolithus albus]